MGRLSTWIFFGLMLLAVSLHDTRADVPSENECRPYIEKALHDLKTGDSSDDSADSSNEVAAPDTGPASNEDGDDSQETNGNSAENASDSDDTPSTETEKSAEDNDDSAEIQVTDDENPTEAVDDGNDSAEEQEQGDENASRTKRETDDGNNGDDDADDSKGDDDNSVETDDEPSKEDDNNSDDDNKSDETNDADGDTKDAVDAGTDEDSEEADAEKKDDTESTEDNAADEKSGEDNGVSGEQKDEDNDSNEEPTEGDQAATDDDNDDSKEQKTDDDADDDNDDSKKDDDEKGDDSKSDETDDGETATTDSKEDKDSQEDNVDTNESKSDEANDEEESKEEAQEPEVVQESAEEAESGREKRSAESDDDSQEKTATAEADNDDDDSASQETAPEQTTDGESEEKKDGEADSKEDSPAAADDGDDSKEVDDTKSSESSEDNAEDAADDNKSGSSESFPEDDLLMEFTIPTNLRDRSHVAELLRLDDDSDEKEASIDKAADVILKDLKRIYENAIKPLETLYKYRDLSNRHFSDPEIFSKPLVLFMGPWSGGKSTILNYLTDNEYTPHSLRTGAEPSPAYFNILMHGDEPEVLDGTQLAADWTFSGLQKFGQGLEDRLRGQKLPHKFLEKVNIVEIPGILEVRKQVSRLFPFNDACQWFIDRADIIFLVYDPSKLDVGPETEAILDQLKGREYQTRILLNKGDQVKPEELLRVQGALIWNISPLMSSAQPPVMYTTSLWSHPYETGAPVRLLQAQERAFLRDLRNAIDKRIDNKIASARRFAVRVRNHAKMVDCYLTTYYNHKTLFGNKKQIADNIIEHPQNYHIYEGLSTLTNISRYDLPDPDVYKDFFRLNSLYEFKKLSETCTYFRGCPINKLDIAIAYDLPELVGKYKKLVDGALNSLDGTDKKTTTGKS